MGLAEGKAAELDGVNQIHALRAVGDVDRRVQVVQKNTDDLAETERDDGEIIPAQSQRRRAQQHTKHAGDQCAQRQQRPERQVQAEMRRGQQRVKISADGVERDVTEIEQPGVADDDVEPEREHDVEQREVEDAHPAAPETPADEERRRRQQYREQDVGRPRDAAVFLSSPQR